MRRTNRISWMRRMAAVIIVVSLVFQSGTSYVMAINSSLLSEVSPVLYSGGTEIYNGMDINAGEPLSARYTFTATRSELAAAGTKEIRLPDLLMAAKQGISAITGTDADGNALDVGTLTIDADKNVTASFLSTLTDIQSKDAAESTGGSTDSGSTEDGESVPESSGASDSESTKSIADTTEIPDPDEGITVNFNVPVLIDTTGLSPNTDGSYTLMLSSGGQSVTVQSVTAESKLSTIVTNRALNFDLLENVVSVYKTELLADGKSISGGAAISTSQILNMIYRFTISSAQAGELQPVVDGGQLNAYYIALPSGLTLPKSASPTSIQMLTKVNTPSGSVSVQYGTLHVDPATNSIYIVFEGDFWTGSDEYYKSGISEGSISLSCVLDMGTIGNQTSYPIQLSSGTTVTINVKDDRTRPTVKKTGTYDGSVFKWTVTYTPGDPELSPFPITLTDTFDKDQHTYVPGSFKVTVYTTETAKTTLSVTNPGDYSTPGTITYTYTPTADAPHHIVFEYQTALTASAYFNEDETDVTPVDTTVENTAAISFPDGSGLPPISDSAEATATADQKKLLIKGVKGVTLGTDGTYAVNPADHMIEWEAVVSTNGLGISKLTFCDQLPAGLTLYADTITIKGGSSTTTLTYTDVSSYTDTDISTAATLTGNELAGPASFCFEIPSANGSYESTYTITYKTKVADSYYTTDTTTDTFDNYASLDIELTEGVVPPEYGKTGPVPAKVNTTLLSKSFTNSSSNSSSTSANSAAYNAENHTIEWIVTLNPHNVNITSGSITDTLPAGLTYDSSSFSATLTSSDGSSLTYTGPDNFTVTPHATNGTTKLELAVGNLGTNKLVIKYKTLVTDAFLLGNIGPEAINYTSAQSPLEYYRNAVNRVDFNGSVNDVPLPKAVTVWSTVRVPVEMLKKSVVTPYNYEDHSIVWEVRVNQNKVSMTTDAVLRDDLTAAYLQYVPNSLKVISVADRSNPSTTSIDDYDPITNYYSVKVETGVDAVTQEEHEILTITLDKDICNDQTVIVQFKTIVNVDDNPEFKTTDSVTISNEIALNGTPAVSSPTSDAEQVIKNDMINKGYGAGYDPTDGTISYSVDINPNDLKLVDCSLTDNLPEELKLDVDSVKLYEADVDAAGTLTKKMPDKLVEPLEWTYDVDNNSFSVPIPEGASCYILEYRCYLITNTSSVSNSVNLTGFGQTMSYGDDVTMTLAADSQALTNLKLQSISLCINKIDSKRPDITIPDITFSLYTYIGGDRVFLERGETDADGNLTFYFLNPDRTYWLVEEGYLNGKTGDYVSVNARVIKENGQEKDALLTNDPMTTYSFTTGSVEDPSTYTTTVITITNDPKSTDIEFLKVRSDDTTVPIPGAGFTITELDTGDRSPYTDTVYSDTDGVVSFKGVPANGAYELEETFAPLRYTGDPAKYTLIIDENGDYWILGPEENIVYESSAPDPWKVENVYNTEIEVIDFQFNKVRSDDTSARLPGAEFELIEITASITDPYKATVTSNSNGEVLFKDIPVAAEYTLRETIAPEWYLKDDTTYKLTVDADGNYVISNADGTVFDSANAAVFEVKNTYTGGPTQAPTDPTPTAPTNPTPTSAPAPTPDNTPSTGDTGMLALWILLFSVTTGGLIVLNVMKRRYKERH